MTFNKSYKISQFSIAQFLKDNFSKLQRLFVPMLYRKLMLTNKCTKHIYKSMNIKDVKQTAFLKWNT